MERGLEVWHMKEDNRLEIAGCDNIKLREKMRQKPWNKPPVGTLECKKGNWIPLFFNYSSVKKCPFIPAALWKLDLLQQ